MWIRDTIGEGFAKKRLVASGTTSSILAGTPAKENGSNVGIVALMANGDGTTSQRFAGLCKTDSNETATAAGVTWTWIPLPGLEYAGKALVAANANTQALIDALTGKRVKFAYTSANTPSFTVDSAQSDSSTNCVIIAGGEYQTSTLYFRYSPQGQTYF